MKTHLTHQFQNHRRFVEKSPNEYVKDSNEIYNQPAILAVLSRDKAVGKIETVTRLCPQRNHSENASTEDPEVDAKQ